MLRSVRSFHVLVMVGLFFLATLLPRTAEASEIFGTWRSTTGNAFEITGSRRGDFKLHVTYSTGAKTTLRGNWVPGMVGTQFQYFDGNTALTGTFNPRDPDKVRVASGSGASWWQRDSTVAVAPRRSSKVFGLWRSTSGNLFEITEAAGGGFGLLMTEAGGRKLSLRGDWVSGLRGTQFEYSDASRKYQGTFNAEDPDRVRVVNGDSVTFWTRSDVATTTLTQAVVPAGPPYICWQAGDPGCARTKDGRAPMDRDTFAAFVAGVRSASPHVFSMVDRFRSGLGQGYLTSRQLAFVLDAFKPHIYPMLDVVKAGAPKLVDPQLGAGVISEKFSPHTMVGTDAAAVVNAQHADP